MPIIDEAELKKLDTPEKVGAALAKAMNEFADSHSEELKQLKTGKGVDPLTEEKTKQIDARLAALSDWKTKLEGKHAELDAWQETIEKKLGRPGGGGAGGGIGDAEVKSFNTSLKAHNREFKRGDVQVDAKTLVEYKANLEKFIRVGKEAMDPAEYKTMLVGVDTAGGFLVTPDKETAILELLRQTSPMLQYATLTIITSDALVGLRKVQGARRGRWVGEQSQRLKTGEAGHEPWRIPAHEIAAAPAASGQSLEDIEDLEGMLIADAELDLTELQNEAFVKGNGVSKPNGFLSYDTVAVGDGARPWGKIEHVATGVSGNFANTNPADILHDLTGAMKDGYKPGAVWAMTSEVLTKIRKFKGEGSQYLWQPGLIAGQPDTLLGYPIAKFFDMPALDAGSLSLAFANFKRGYRVVQRRGFRLLRDPYTDVPNVIFHITGRVGGDVNNFEAIKVAKFGS